MSCRKLGVVGVLCAIGSQAAQQILNHKTTTGPESGLTSTSKALKQQVQNAATSLHTAIRSYNWHAPFTAPKNAEKAPVRMGNPMQYRVLADHFATMEEVENFVVNNNAEVEGLKPEDRPAVVDFYLEIAGKAFSEQIRSKSETDKKENKISVDHVPALKNWIKETLTGIRGEELTEKLPWNNKKFLAVLEKLKDTSDKYTDIMTQLETDFEVKDAVEQELKVLACAAAVTEDESVIFVTQGEEFNKNAELCRQKDNYPQMVIADIVSDDTVEKMCKELVKKDLARNWHQDIVVKYHQNIVDGCKQKKTEYQSVRVEVATLISQHCQDVVQETEMFTSLALEGNTVLLALTKMCVDNESAKDKSTFDAIAQDFVTAFPTENATCVQDLQTTHKDALQPLLQAEMEATKYAESLKNACKIALNIHTRALDVLMKKLYPAVFQKTCIEELKKNELIQKIPEISDDVLAIACADSDGKHEEAFVFLNQQFQFVELFDKLNEKSDGPAGPDGDITNKHVSLLNTGDDEGDAAGADDPEQKKVSKCVMRVKKNNEEIQMLETLVTKDDSTISSTFDLKKLCKEHDFQHANVTAAIRISHKDELEKVKTALQCVKDVLHDNEDIAKLMKVEDEATSSERKTLERTTIFTECWKVDSNAASASEAVRKEHKELFEIAPVDGLTKCQVALIALAIILGLVLVIGCCFLMYSFCLDEDEDEDEAKDEFEHETSEDDDLEETEES